jgi:hypothetical protein
MGEFIFNRGRSRTAHGYPETRAGANAPPIGLLARNFAAGPPTPDAQAIDVSPGTQVQWVAAVPGTNPEDVPITPRVTGLIQVSGVITVANTSGSTRQVQVQIEFNSTTLPVPQTENTAVSANVAEETNGYLAIPFLVEFLPGTPLGTQVNVHVRLTALTTTSLELPVLSSTIVVQEVLPRTG